MGESNVRVAVNGCQLSRKVSRTSRLKLYALTCPGAVTIKEKGASRTGQVEGRRYQPLFFALLPSSGSSLRTLRAPAMRNSRSQGHRARFLPLSPLSLNPSPFFFPFLAFFSLPFSLSFLSLVTQIPA